MEIKIIVMYLLAGGGFASWISGVVTNWKTWKGDVLFVLGAAFMLVKLAVFLARSWQDYRYREWKLREKERDFDEEP